MIGEEAENTEKAEGTEFTIENTEDTEFTIVNSENTEDTTALIPMQTITELMTIETSEGRKDVTAFRVWIGNTHKRCNGEESNPLLVTRRNELRVYLSNPRPAKVILEYSKKYPEIVGQVNHETALRKLHMPLTRVQGSVMEWGEWNAA